MSQPLSSPSDSSLRSPAITILSSVPRILSIPIPPHYLTAASSSFSLLGFFLRAVVAARSLNPDWMMAKRNNESRPKCPRLRRSYRDTDPSNCLRWDITDFGAITIICVGHGCHVLLGMFDHWFDKKLSGIYPGYYGTSAPQCNSQLGKESRIFAPTSLKILIPGKESGLRRKLESTSSRSGDHRVETHLPKYGEKSCRKISGRKDSFSASNSQRNA